VQVWLLCFFCFFCWTRIGALRMASKLLMLFFADTILTIGEHGGPHSFKRRGGDTNGGGMRSTAGRRRKIISKWLWKESRRPGGTLASGQRCTRPGSLRTRCEGSNGYEACGQRSSRESKTFLNLPSPISRLTKNQTKHRRD
jgi:hypothetical protein